MLNCSRTSNLASSPPSAARISTILMDVSPLGWDVDTGYVPRRLQRGDRGGFRCEHEIHISRISQIIALERDSGSPGANIFRRSPSNPDGYRPMTVCAVMIDENCAGKRAIKRYRSPKRQIVPGA